MPSKTEKLLIGFCLLVAVGFLCSSMIHGQAHEPEYGRMLTVSAAEVIGDNPDAIGAASSSATLVEFGDYECQPCRAAVPVLVRYLKADHQKLRFVFRNYPLVTIHPYAYDAAILAEAAKQKGEFWAVHDAMYSGDVDVEHLTKISRRFRLGSRQDDRLVFDKAAVAVANDMRACDKIGVSATPTFILCYPDGGVVQLASLNELPRALSGGGKTF